MLFESSNGYFNSLTHLPSRPTLSQGPLCSRCRTRYYRDSTTDACYDCDDASSTAVTRRYSVIFFIATVACVGIAFMVAFGHSANFRAYYLKHEEYVLEKSHHFTLFILTIQICVSFQTVHIFLGGSPFVDPFGGWDRGETARYSNLRTDTFDSTTHSRSRPTLSQALS